MNNLAKPLKVLNQAVELLIGSNSTKQIVKLMVEHPYFPYQY
jgi:hypothetical protein